MRRPLEEHQMRRPRQVLVHRFSCLLAISLGVVACQYVESRAGGALESYAADDININNGTVRGNKISTLLDVEVNLTGLVKSAPNGSTIMYLSHDKNDIVPGSYRNCINLIIDRKLKFNSPTVSDYVFTGKFILIDRPDIETLYMTYDKIRFDMDCQAFKEPDQYPYFVVRRFQK